MHIITITRWKRKLVALFVVVAFVICLGWGLNLLSDPQEASVSAPAEQDLQKDVMSQPIKVQAEPGEVNNPVEETSEIKIK
ncbi:MAG: hypothetical protein CVU87_06195 [Firmicutes bacterium HGW-Firmicutes-12]|jgi:Tfp pilus assembly protein PilO|nr:MAG: hypothetical protein CVU87_06195 [Firmicutes bacterium HGW-Firmicutes-12]